MREQKSPDDLVYRYGYQGEYSEKDLETGWNHFEAREFDCITGRWTTADPEREFPSPYKALANNPTVHTDPDGERIFWVGGAGNDPGGWDYDRRWAMALISVGIKDFYELDAYHGKVGDMIFSANFSNERYRYTGTLGLPVKLTDSKINDAVSQIISNLEMNPLEVGEQLNLSGYSYGSVLQAHVALELADRGYKIDNLVLIGSPIADNSALFQELTQHENIGKVIREDIPNDKLSNPKYFRFLGGIFQNMSDDGPHFDYARPGLDVDRLIMNVAKRLFAQGVR